MPPAPKVNPSAERAAAYQQLLNAAALRGDAGASSQMMADTLNGVDMGGADRMKQRWADYSGALSSAGMTELSALQAAYAAQRARSGRRRTSGGGGGGGALSVPTAMNDPYWTWINQQINGPTPAPPSSPAAPSAHVTPPRTYPKVPRW